MEPLHVSSKNIKMVWKLQFTSLLYESIIFEGNSLEFYNFQLLYTPTPLHVVFVVTGYYVDTDHSVLISFSLWLKTNQSVVGGILRDTTDRQKESVVHFQINQLIRSFNLKD